MLKIEKKEKKYSSANISKNAKIREKIEIFV